MQAIEAKSIHVDYIRVSNKPLIFGMEEQVVYYGHKHMQIKGVLLNKNNNVYVSWDPKTLHIWNTQTGKKQHTIKMIDLTKTHCSISAVAFSHKYRVS